VALVVDASAIGAIMFGEPEGPGLVEHLEGETLLAPSLLDYELTNLALKKARRQRAQASNVLVSLHAALALPITRVAVPGIDAFDLATRTGLTAYDAAYLWLARSRDLELVTLDAELLEHVRD
jgi:predicted nucleic acid-binding protein